MRFQRGEVIGAVRGRFGPAVTLCLVVALGACSTPTPLPPPEPIVRTVTVDRVIQVPCVSKLPDLPMYSDTDAALGMLGNDFNAVWDGIALLKGGRAQRDAAIAQYRAILAACAAGP